MAQFSCLTFDKIGSISEDESGSVSFLPCFDYDAKDDGTVQVVTSGPFDTTPA